MNYRIPVYRQQQLADWSDSEMSIPDKVTYQVIDIDITRLAPIAERFIMESRYRLGYEDGRWLLIGWDGRWLLIGWDILHQVADVPKDMDRIPFFQILGNHQIMGYRIILVGSMDGIALLPRLEPLPKPQMPLNERGELIVAHMNAVAKQATNYAMRMQTDDEYRRGMLNMIAIFCDGLGIQLPQTYDIHLQRKETAA